MSGDRGPTSTAVGLHLLPSELLHSILRRLPLPDLLRLRSLSRPLLSLISDPDFLHIYASATPSSPWLFLFKKRPPRRSLLRAFNPLSARWFSFPALSALIEPAVPPGEDIYLLAAAGDLFLFASNGLRQLIAVDLTAKTVKKIPNSPLGPRGTSSWRRSGLKLVSDSAGTFRFLFAELYRDRPVLFEYRSDTDTWRSMEANEGRQPPRVGKLCLHMVQSGDDSLVLCIDGPAVYRPILKARHMDSSYRLHVYGDGNMAVVRSTAVIVGGGARMMAVKGVEVWGLSMDGREWGLVSRVDEGVIEGIRKPYGVMMGCLEERDGVIRLVLMSNCKGVWDLTWLSFDRARGAWERVPVPDCGTEGLNMAGIAISSSFLGFSR